MRTILTTRDKTWAVLDILPGMPKTDEGRRKAETALRGAIRSRWFRRSPLVFLLAAGISVGNLGNATDSGALAQRPILQALKEIFEQLDREKNTIWKLAQEAGNAYKTYKVAQSLYQRIHSGNIGLTVSLTLPSVIEVPLGSVGNGAVETLMIRPNSPWNNPANADLTAFSGMLGQSGVTIDYQGLLNQLSGLALGDWDFDNYRVELDPRTKQVKKEVNLSEEMDRARQNAVGSFVLAGRVFSDSIFARKYFASNGASGSSSGNLILDYNQLATVYKKSEFDRASAVDGMADASESAAAAAGLPVSAFAIFQRAQAQGIRDMANQYTAGSPGGDLQVAISKNTTAKGAMAAENIGNAGAAQALAADSSAKATQRAKDMKQWYDVLQSGRLNLAEFFLKSLYPNGSVDTSQHGAKGEGYKASNIAQAQMDQHTLGVKTANAAEASKNAQILMDLPVEQEVRKQTAAAEARAADGDISMANSVKSLASPKLSTPYPVTVSTGSFTWSFTLDASNQDANQGADQGEAAASAALGRSFDKIQSQFADGIIDFKGVGEVIQKILDAFNNSGMILFGSVFNDPEPDDRADVG